VIVPKDSAVLHLQPSQETVIALDRDHSALRKFNSADDEEFKQVIANLTKMARDAIASSEYSLIYNKSIDKFQRYRLSSPSLSNHIHL
jgi:nitrogen fixation/metabolism regulation signal transduction histidine kinase